MGDLLLAWMLYVSPVRHTAAPPTTTTTVTTTTTIPTDVPAALTDWTPSMLAVWTCEEAAAGDSIEDQTGSVDNDLGVAGTGNVERDTVLFREGVKSCKFVNAENDRANCPDADCGPDFDRTGLAITIGGWWYSTDDAQDRPLAFKRTTGSILGFNVQRESATDAFACQFGDGVAPYTTVNSADNTFEASPAAWTHGVCVWDPAETAAEIRVHVNGAASANGNKNTWTAADAADFEVGNNGNHDMQMDEVYIDGAAHAPEDSCRIASCGLDGSFCKRSTNEPTKYFDCAQNSDCGGSLICSTAVTEDNCDDASCCVGRNVSLAGDCDLPAANEAAP
jgi:hypothetical protein